MDSSSQDRNLPASERKLQKAREDGQVARSHDLSHLAVLGGGALSFFALAPMMVARIKNEFSLQLMFDAHAMQDPTVMLHRLGTMVLVGLVACAVFAAIIAVIAIVSTVAVGGWVASNQLPQTSVELIRSAALVACSPKTRPPRY